MTATSRAEVIAQAQSGTYANSTAAFRTFNSISQTGPWDEELCAAMPPSLKFIAHNGAGYDQLSTPALSAHNILACNVPTAVDDATADTALFLLIGALRNFPTSLAALRRGDWRGKPPPALGHDPRGKTLGILGMGGIGRNFAHKARALGMQIAYHNRNKLSPELEAGATYRSFDELLATSDVLSVHVPLSAATHHLLGKEQFAKCKRGAVLINTARGAVVDEAALVDALSSGQIGSAGLDVFEKEPAVHPGLVENENVLLLPHMGTWSVETQVLMEQWCVDNLVLALGPASGWKGMSVVPEQKDLLRQWIGNGEAA